MDAIIEFDQYLFELINNGWQNTFFDWLMPHWREKTFWIPLYLFLLLFVLIKFKLKGLFFALGLALTVGVADTMSSKVIKENVKRLRPCNDLEFKNNVHLLVRCGGGYSFTSSHATNHFAIAAFISLTLGLLYPAIKLPFYLWAASIALGQVYVGVHYPLDIFFGAFLGVSIGYLVAKLYNRFPNLALQ